MTNTASSPLSSLTGRTARRGLARPARRPRGEVPHRRLIREIQHWPKTEILLRADSQYCTEVLDLLTSWACVMCLARAAMRLQEEVQTLGFDGSASRAQHWPQGQTVQDIQLCGRLWSKPAAWSPASVSSRGATRYIVTNLDDGRNSHLYEGYSARGQAENHIKGWKTHLASDRTSCTKVSANQMRLKLHGCAYWIWWTLPGRLLKRSQWRHAQFVLCACTWSSSPPPSSKKTCIVMTLPASSPRQSLIGCCFSIASASAQLTLNNTPAVDNPVEPRQTLSRLTTSTQPPARP